MPTTWMSRSKAKAGADLRVSACRQRATRYDTSTVLHATIVTHTGRIRRFFTLSRTMKGGDSFVVTDICLSFIIYRYIA